MTQSALETKATKSGSSLRGDVGSGAASMPLRSVVTRRSRPNENKERSWISIG